jgi:hypothetical protein
LKLSLIRAALGSHRLDRHQQEGRGYYECDTRTEFGVLHVHIFATSFPFNVCRTNQAVLVRAVHGTNNASTGRLMAVPLT